MTLKVYDDNDTVAGFRIFSVIKEHRFQVHLAVIFAFHAVVEVKPLFSHEVSERFIKGLNNLYSPRTPIVSLNSCCL